MKLSTSLVSALLVTGASAFAPKTFVPKQSAVSLADGKTPFFGSSASKPEPTQGESEQEEIERMVQEEMRKTKKISNLRNSKGVDYAPWMNISADDEKKIRQLMAEKAAARRKRQEQERSVSGALLMDSQAQELSGVGLNYKIVGTDVELSWATSREANTKEFQVKRRPAKTERFETIATMPSKGIDGGLYKYFDDEAGPGGWVYRITEIESNGRASDISQCLVEVQTKEEQTGAILAAGGIVALLGGLVVAGTLLDPNGGF